MMKYRPSISQKMMNTVQNSPKKESMNVQTALVVVAFSTIASIPVANGV